MTKITKEQLASILSEEFKQEWWGDIDPFLFELVASKQNDEVENDYSFDFESLTRVLDRVATRLNNLRKKNGLKRPKSRSK